MREIKIQRILEKSLSSHSNKPKSITDNRFKEVDLKVISTIQLCLSNEVLQRVAKEPTMTTLWLKLELVYMTKLVANWLQLKSWLHSLKLSNGQSLKIHLNEFDSIGMDLYIIYVKLNNEDLAIILLCSFPTGFKHFS